MRRWALVAAAALAAGSASSARADDGVTLSTPIEQGALVRGSATPGVRVSIDGKPIRIAPDGRFIFGLGRDAPAHATLTIGLGDGETVTRDLAVTPRRYEVQRIDGLAPTMVTPDPAMLARIKTETEKIHAARAIDSDALDFETPLIWPAVGPISGVYGSQRVLNGEPRSPHLGIDIAAPAGAPVVAAAAGTVTLAERDFYFTGGTVILDHGYGLSTIYQHMANVAVAVGDHVAQGQTIGMVGATGRVTGAHLHWGVSWYATALDPALVAGPMPQ